MPDEIDAAQDHIERTMAATLAAQRAKQDDMPPCGKCYNCGEPLDSELFRFCDIACRDDFQLRKKHGKR